ncbi:MAG: hypothetical protein ACW99A_23260 [Candidatus Kariarchaeaceae archaeon]|jgi:hypothetical protein
MSTHTIVEEKILLNQLEKKEGKDAAIQVKKGNLITFKTESDDKYFYELIIPNHDRLFDQDDKCIIKSVRPGVPDKPETPGTDEHVVINANYDLVRHSGKCERYIHVLRHTGDVKKGTYIDIKDGSPPKIVVM